MSMTVNIPSISPARWKMSPHRRLAGEVDSGSGASVEALAMPSRDSVVVIATVMPCPPLVSDLVRRERSIFQSDDEVGVVTDRGRRDLAARMTVGAGATVDAEHEGAVAVGQGE